MAFSFDNLVYFSSLIMFIVALICVFVYEFISLKPSTISKEPKVTDTNNKKGKRYKKQTDKIA
jgi:hypothetical protein